MIQQLIKLSDGNPGAMTFLMSIFAGLPTVETLSIMYKIETCGIKGTDLYVLYSDLCNKDMSKVIKLCEKCPDDILINACSRQDYSGRELIKSYIE